MPEMPENPLPDHAVRSDGATIAYHRTPGKSPGVVFLTGFRSDMEGSKALALEDFCRARGQAFLRFDYFGHGASSGDFVDGTIGRWAADAVFALDTLTDGPQVLVGSSMGGWLMLLAALKRPERIVGLLGIAAAPDFTEDLIPAELSSEQHATLEKNGAVAIPNCYDEGDPYLITKALLDDGRDHLLLRKPINLNLPVRLIQGLKDEDVPWQTALKIQEKLSSDDVEITFVKDGTHRLSEPHDLDRLTDLLASLLAKIEQDGL